MAADNISPELAGRLVRIDDGDDPRIAAFRDVRERDLTGREGRFIAEGTVVLRMLAQSHSRGADFAAECLLVLENRVAGISDLLERLPATVPVYVVSSTVMDAIAGFHLHRGILALGRRNAPMRSAGQLIAGLPQRSLVTVACGISNHDNIGAMFRNAAAFRASAVFLDSTCCDPLYRKALRVSVGTVLAVPYSRGGSAIRILEALAAAGFAIWALSPRGAVELRDIPDSPRMALVTGTEGEGLGQDVMSAFATARIAQSPDIDSLNAGTASGLALYRMSSVMGLV